MRAAGAQVLGAVPPHSSLPYTTNTTVSRARCQVLSPCSHDPFRHCACRLAGTHRSEGRGCGGSAPAARRATRQGGCPSPRYGPGAGPAGGLTVVRARHRPTAPGGRRNRWVPMNACCPHLAAGIIGCLRRAKRAAPRGGTPEVNRPTPDPSNPTPAAPPARPAAATKHHSREPARHSEERYRRACACLRVPAALGLPRPPTTGGLAAELLSSYPWTGRDSEVG